MKRLLEALSSLWNSIRKKPVVHVAPVLEFPPTKETSFTTVFSPNFTKTTQPRQIKYLIIHATEGEKKSALPWLSSRESQASAHYLIDRDGSVYQLVEEADVAWHAGVSEWKGDKSLNSRSIGIELVNLNNGKDPYLMPQMGVLMKVCTDICKRYNIPCENVLGHKDIAPTRKTDPGVLFPWLKFRNELLTHLNKKP